MDDRGLYWLAGLLEGEGSFYRNGHRPTIAVCMTDRDVIERVAALFGGLAVSRRAPQYVTSRRKTVRTHGVTMYRHGCRCEVCAEAKHQEYRRRRARQGLDVRPAGVYGSNP